MVDPRAHVSALLKQYWWPRRPVPISDATLCWLPNRILFLTGLHFKSHAPRAHEFVAIHLERNGPRAIETLPYRVKHMASRTDREVAVSANSARLEALLDKLVAVQMDLDPICGTGGGRVPVLAARDAIAGACTILHSAIADVRNIIYQVDGLTDPADAVAAQD